MKTFNITFLKFDGTHQTVQVRDIDDNAAQMQVILRYNVKMIVRVVAL